MAKKRGPDLKAVRQALERERAEIEELSATAAEARRPVELDQQSVGRLSRMDALQVQAMAQAVDARRRERLQRIAAALGRVEDGEYGYCAECGEEIPPKRLAIEPTIERCIDCAG